MKNYHLFTVVCLFELLSQGCYFLEQRICNFGLSTVILFFSSIHLFSVLRNLFSQVFGPLLPIVDVESLDDAIDFINDR